MIATLGFLLVLAAEAPGGQPAATPPAEPPQASAPAPAGGSRDTLTRVPGSPLRLGWTHERTSALGAFTQQSANGEVTVRHGEVRWFGTTSQATLTYVGDRLRTVRLECANPTPALRSYAPDELRRSGYRRVKLVVANGTEQSDWSGPCDLSLTASAGSLVAEMTARTVSPPPVAANATPSPAGGSTPPVAASAGGGAMPAAAAAGETSTGVLPGELDFTTTRMDSLPVPRVVSTPPPPVRPRIAIDAGLFGRVQVRARVDTTGHVVHAEIARGIAEFNSAALAWAADVRYEPYRVNGRATPVVVLIPVVFSRIDTGRPNP